MLQHASRLLRAGISQAWRASILARCEFQVRNQSNRIIFLSLNCRSSSLSNAESIFVFSQIYATTSGADICFEQRAILYTDIPAVFTHVTRRT